MEFDQFAPSIFKNDQLREIILKYVLYDSNDFDEDPKLSIENIHSCRSVNKYWMTCISKILLKFRKPFFRFCLHEENSVNGSEGVAENGKLLDNFLAAVTGPTRLVEQVPPFSIRATEHFFRHENYQSLLNCFKKCGNSLVRLSIEFPQDGGSMVCTFPNLSLPNLGEFKVEFLEEDQENIVAFAESEKLVGPASGTFLIHEILSGCKQLDKLKFYLVHNACLPYGFEQILLPETIKTLSCSLSPSEGSCVHLLTRNALPKLTYLDLHYKSSSSVYGENSIQYVEEIFTVLDTVKTTLIELNIYDVDYKSAKESSIEPRCFRLPVMDRLNRFTIRSKSLEPEPNVSKLETNFINLQILYLRHLSLPMFHKWTRDSCFKSVKQLGVSLVHKMFNPNHENYYMGCGELVMQIVHVAFPNIEMLDIIVCGNELRGLQFAFRNLKTLKVLKVIVKNSEHITNSDTWDALLIGITLQVATTLTTTNTWKEISDFNSESNPSIQNLTELTELALRTQGRAHDALISDAAFKFAFFKMPKLKTLVLRGRFMASLAVRKEWEKNKRTFK